MEPKMQNTFRYLAIKKIKQIMTTTTHNTLHKRYQHNIKQIRNILQQNNLTITQADKSKSIVIINKSALIQKVDDLIQENHTSCLNKGPTDTYQKQIQSAIQKCNTLIDKHTQKYLINIKPMAPKLNVYIKTHKENKLIRPTVNNTHAPAYRTAKYLNKKLNSLINLPYTYTTKNAQEVAEELKKIHFDEHMKIITLDIKDLYVNLPIQGILQTTKFWLSKHNTSTTIEQILQLLETILKQNYFQYNNQLFHPEKGIAMGSPISSTMEEIYIQFLEELYVKQWLDSRQTLYYKRHVDDILIIYNQNKTNEQDILNQRFPNCAPLRDWKEK